VLQWGQAMASTTDRQKGDFYILRCATRVSAYSGVGDGFIYATPSHCISEAVPVLQWGQAMASTTDRQKGDFYILRCASQVYA
jgi:hypothetical protein